MLRAQGRRVRIAGVAVVALTLVGGVAGFLVHQQRSAEELRAYDASTEEVDSANEVVTAAKSDAHAVLSEMERTLSDLETLDLAAVEEYSALEAQADAVTQALQSVVVVNAQSQEPAIASATAANTLSAEHSVVAAKDLTSIVDASRPVVEAAERKASSTAQSRYLETLATAEQTLAAAQSTLDATDGKVNEQSLRETLAGAIADLADAITTTASDPSVTWLVNTTTSLGDKVKDTVGAQDKVTASHRKWQAALDAAPGPAGTSGSTEKAPSSGSGDNGTSATPSTSSGSSGGSTGGSSGGGTGGSSGGGTGGTSGGGWVDDGTRTWSSCDGRAQWELYSNGN